MYTRRGGWSCAPAMSSEERAGRRHSSQMYRLDTVEGEPASASCGGGGTLGARPPHTSRLTVQIYLHLRILESDTQWCFPNLNRFGSVSR